ncbi:MAG: transcriptional regulator [Crenarchaeota archaeon]|nr:transcriptional regulator [Thermoproteota archaeon]
MAGIEKTIHIIPLGYEIDRAVIPFETTKADKIYLLVYDKNDESSEPGEKNTSYYLKSVRKRLEEKKIDVVCQYIDIFNLLELMKKISNIIVEEKGNRVFINMSAAGKMSSVAATLVGMAHDVQVYYVHADDYSDDIESRKNHGLSVCTSGDTTILSNFKFMMPDPIGMQILLHFCEKNLTKMRSKQILDLLQEKKAEGFEDVFDKISDITLKRSIQSRQIMKLNKTILTRLENGGFITRKKDGRNVMITITESGKYAVHISGLLS